MELLNQTESLKKVFNFSCERYLRTAGDLFIYDGNYEDALELVDKTLELEPEQVRALVLRGDILYCLNRDEDALDSLNQALQLDPCCVEGWISRAGVMDALGRASEGAASCQEALLHIRSHQAYLLPCLFEQYVSLLIQLKRFRQASHVLGLALSQLGKKDANSLREQFSPSLDRLNRQRQQALKKAKELDFHFV